MASIEIYGPSSHSQTVDAPATIVAEAPVTNSGSGLGYARMRITGTTSEPGSLISIRPGQTKTVRATASIYTWMEGRQVILAAHLEEMDANNNIIRSIDSHSNFRITVDDPAERLRLAEEEARLAEEERQRQALEEQRVREEEEQRRREEYEREQDALRQAEINERQRAEELLRHQQEEDARYAKVEQDRLDAEYALEQERQLAARRLQELFWQQQEDERRRLLAQEEIRIAEERARIPVVEPKGSLRVDPNIAIATGGAKDVMDVTWGYSYISGQPHLFFAMRVLHQGGYDQSPPHEAPPGTERSNWRFRFVPGIYQPGTHSVTVQVLTTPTDRNVWTVHFEETVSFTIAAPVFHRRSLDDVANELGWAVYRQGKGYGYYADGMYAYFHGRNKRVQDRWIREWYEGAKVGKLGPKMREGQLGYDRQRALTAP